MCGHVSEVFTVNLLFSSIFSKGLFLLVKHITENGTLMVCSKIQSALLYSFVVKHHFTITHQGQPLPPCTPAVEIAVSLKSSICIDLSAV